jgi:hypothetical protein
MSKIIPIIILSFISSSIICHKVHNVEHHEALEELDVEHLKIDLKELMNKTVDNMTEHELNFYHFKLYDENNDNIIDGLEIAHNILKHGI